jgi:hypothetical protein
VINQANGKIKLVVSSTKIDNLSLKLVDILGKELLLQNFTVAIGNNSKALQLKNGVYVVTLTNSAGERVSNKIIVQ